MEFSLVMSSILLFFTGVLASFINVTAGGGSSLSLPVLIFLGVDPSVANGTNRLAILLQNASASASFRNEKVYQTKESVIYALLTIPGAVLGAYYATRISDELFRKALAIVMIGVVISLIIPKSNIKEGVKKRFSWLIYPGFVVLGFYGGFIQVGIGILIMALIQRCLDCNLVLTNVHKAFIIMLNTIPSLIIFVITGNMIWTLGIALAVGMTAGAWWAARLSVRKGEKFIKQMLVAALVLIALKLVGII